MISRRHERAAHALVAHRDAVAHRDRHELDREAAGVADAVLRPLGQPVERHVAGRDLVPATTPRRPAPCPSRRRSCRPRGASPGRGARSMPSVTSWLRGFMSAMSRKAIASPQVMASTSTRSASVGLIGAGPWARAVTGPVFAAGPETDARRRVVAHRRARANESPARSASSAYDGRRRVDRGERRGRDRGHARSPSPSSRSRARPRPASRCCSRSRSPTTSPARSRIVDAIDAAGVGSLLMLTYRFHPRLPRLRRGGRCAIERARRARLLPLRRVPSREPVRKRLAPGARRAARRRTAPPRPPRARARRDRRHQRRRRSATAGLRSRSRTPRASRAKGRCAVASRWRAARTSSASDRRARCDSTVATAIGAEVGSNLRARVRRRRARRFTSVRRAAWAPSPRARRPADRQLVQGR